MFAKLFTVASLAILAAATPAPNSGSGSGSTPPATQCCSAVEKASSPSATALLGLLGIVLSDLNVLVGLNCSPITVVGVGSGACSTNTVSCQDNSHGGLISIGCVPVTL
ncbi:fungal hydrophobin-domain-containing protein [Daedaleopsis nitida]|nr:fungal hydrophobin-domain-containing protein [Daedaleopsis nitida]KAI0737144.1 fungal hydrophobin-domain-containing protein [Daedaleopsis nitida]